MGWKWSIKGSFYTLNPFMYQIIVKWIKIYILDLINLNFMYLKHSAIFCVILFLLMCSSCKKKDEPANTTPDPPATDNRIYGELIVMKRELSNTNTLTPNYQLNIAYFDWDGLDYGTSGVYTTVDAVSLNTTSLTLMPGYSYRDSTTINSPYYWNVSSSDPNIPSFTHIVSGMPSSINGPYLQDTIFLTQNNVIKLTGIASTDEVEVVFASGFGSIGFYPPLGSDSIIVSPPYFVLPGTGTISVTAYKNSEATFNNKKFKFRLAHRVEKTNVVFK